MRDGKATLTVLLMATRTRNPEAGHVGTDWLASCARDPASIHRAWVRKDLTPLVGGDRGRATEADLMQSVAAMQRIGPEPDGTDKLTDPVAPGTAFGPTAGPRLAAEAFG
jgi:hypothetical protein